MFRVSCKGFMADDALDRKTRPPSGDNGGLGVRQGPGLDLGGTLVTYVA